MPTEPLPIASPVYRNADKIALTDENSYLMNAFLNELKASVKFPGYIDAEAVSIPTIWPRAKILGMYWWESQQKLVTVGNKATFISTYSSLTSSWTSAQSGSTHISGTTTPAGQTGAVGNEYTSTYSPTLSAYTTNQMYTFTVSSSAGTSVDNPLCNLDGVGNVEILDSTGAYLAAGDIEPGDILALVYDGTNFIRFTTNRSIDDDEPVSFAVGWNSAFTEFLYFCNGEHLNYLTTDDEQNIWLMESSPASPAYATVAVLDGYTLVNQKDTQQVYYELYPDPELVLANSGSGVFQGASLADNVIGIYVVNQELYLLGAETTETWEDDGATPFSRRPGGVKKRGCSAKNSVIERAEGLYYLDEERRFVHFDGNFVKDISTPYDKEIQDEATTVSDCIGQVMTISGKTFFILAFPTWNRTLLYNKSGETWSELGLYDSINDRYNRLPINFYAYVPQNGQHLGSRSDEPSIMKFATTNYDFDGESCRMLRETGGVNRGTNRQKVCKRLTIRLKRGVVADGVVMVRWQDDNKYWCNWKEFDLGAVGNTESILNLNRLGIYRTRRWQVAATSDTPIIYLDAKETFEVLPR